MNALIDVKDVSKRYDNSGAFAVEDVSLRVAAGEAVAVMGPSGSGKSTLLNLIAGLDRPTTGMVTVAGQRIDSLSETGLARYRRQRVGMIFQFFNLLDDLTVADNVLLPAQLAGLPKSAARRRADELLERLKISQHRQAYPARLSGGERQRVAIARALINAPELLLADEPTGALDTTTGEEIGELLRELNQAGQSMIMVTHNPALAARYASRTIQIIDGLAGRGAGGVTARPVLRAASGGVTRHRAQTFVIFMVLLVSTASAALGLALLAAANGPFDQAFSAQRGADAAVAVSSSRASAAQLAGTRQLPGVTAAAGPFGSATVTLTSQGISLPSSVVIGRAAPGGPLDDLTLVTGHWPQRPDQIVLAEGTGFFPGLGATMTVPSAPGRPALTVVGVANSVTGTASAWVLPGEIAALRPAGAPAGSEMLYRFTNASTAAEIRGDVSAISAALPAGAVDGFASWLSAREQATGNSAILAPFVEAFALIGLFMSVLIVANVVSGAVVASYRRIGVLKSIGFTPAQVIAAYVARVGLPAVAGCLAGLAAGNLLAIPVLHNSAASFGVGQQQVPLWVNIVTPVVMCALVALTALVPALRAGRLSAVQAIALGHAPREGRGYSAHRFASRLRLPRPVSIGLAAPFARPARTAGLWRPSCSASPRWFSPLA